MIGNCDKNSLKLFKTLIKSGYKLTFISLEASWKYTIEGGVLILKISKSPFFSLLVPKLIEKLKSCIIYLVSGMLSNFSNRTFFKFS